MNKALFIPPLLIFSVVAGGVTLDRSREKQRSILSGVFESQPTLVAARTEGRVGKISAPEGALVKPGELLLTLDAAPGQSDAAALEGKVREARARYQELKAGPRREDIRRQEAAVAELRAALERLHNGNRPAEIATAKARWMQAEAVYRKAVNGPRRQDVERLQAAADQASFRQKFAQSDLAKLRKLYAEDEISRQSLEKAETDFQASQAAYREAERTHRSLQLGTRQEEIAAARADADGAHQQYLLLAQGSRREDVDASQARLEQALAQLQELCNGNRIEDIEQGKAAFDSASLSAESARLRVQENRVVAPLAGQVERVLVSQGDLVAPNTALVRIADPDDIWLRVYLPAKQLAKVKVGDAAEIAVDGGVDVTGKVDTIATQGEFTPANLQTPEDRGKQVFAVRLRLAKPDARVKAGMSATVRRVGQWP